MYSYAERIRAIKLYIKLGKRLNATIRQLGYPTKNSLIGWYREYTQDQDLRAGYLRSEWKYSAQQKQLAVQHFLDNDRCIAATIKALAESPRGDSRRPPPQCPMKHNNKATARSNQSSLAFFCAAFQDWRDAQCQSHV